MSADSANERGLDGDVQLLKGSDKRKFTMSLNGLVARGYGISVFNITMKVVPRIGKVVTYFAELRLSAAKSGRVYESDRKSSITKKDLLGGRYYDNKK